MKFFTYVTLKLPKLASSLYPSFIPTILGQSSLTTTFEPIGPGIKLYNICFIISYILIFFYAVNNATTEDAYGSKGYSFISKIKYIVQLHCSSAFMCYIIYKQTTSTRIQVKGLRIHNDAVKNLDDLSINKKGNSLVYNIISVAFLVILVPAALIFDIIRTPRPVGPFLRICLFLPGISIVIYVIGFVTNILDFMHQFARINMKLEEFAHQEFSCTETIYFRRQNVRPFELLKKFKGSHLNLLDRLLMEHKQLCNSLSYVNKIYGTSILLFYLQTSAAALSLFYHSLLDLMALSRGDSISPANTRVCDYWILINFIALILLTSVCIDMDENGQETANLVQRLINVYPEVEKFGEMYMLQLLNSNTSISASDFFVVDRTVAYGLVGSWATYLIILIQFSD